MTEEETATLVAQLETYDVDRVNKLFVDAMAFDAAGQVRRRQRERQR